MKMKKWLKFSLGTLAMALAAQGAHAQTRGGTLSMIVQPEPPIIIPAMNQ